MANNNKQCDAAVNYGSIQQLNKKEDGKERKPIFPVTPIQAVYDARTGASLEAILAQFNAIYVQYQGTPEATRNIIPVEMRRAGLTITYMDMESNTITERANSAVQKDNDHWALDVNWSRVDELSLLGDISVSAKGTWIINGKDTGIKALGPKGDTGLTPWLKTIANKLHFSYDNVTWEPCSENIAAWFRWSGNKIQVSRDNKTWTDLSGKFADNVHIKGYVANYASLPSGAVQGEIYGVGPTYAAEDTAHTNPIYRYYVRNANTWVDNGSFTSLSAGVVQETGDSETEVMSQKAVTNVIDKFTEFSFNSMDEFGKLSQKRITSTGDVESYNYDNLILYKVVPGRLYNVRGQHIGSEIILFGYYSESDLSSSTLIELGKITASDAILTNYNIKTKAPEGSNFLVISRYFGTTVGINEYLNVKEQIKGEEIKAHIENTDDYINELQSKLSTETGINSIDTLYGYITGSGSIVDNQYYRLSVYNVQEGDKVRMKFSDISSTASRLYAIYSSDTTLDNTTVIAVGPQLVSATDLTITIPKDAKTIVFCGWVNWKIGNILKVNRYGLLDNIGNTLPNFYIDYKSDKELSVIRKYDSTRDLAVVLKNCGVNDLVQIYSYGYIDNADDFVKSGSPTNPIISRSDWVGPYVCKANSRAGSYNGFTGGFHGYNGDATGARTASTENVIVLIDNKVKSSGGYYANDIKVIVTNLIQAGNTKTEDGNGIDVLREVVTYHFTGNKINVSVEAIALESVSISTYYGMQVNSFNSTIKYVSDSVEVGDFNINNKTINNNLKYIVCSNSNNEYIKAQLDNVGLGMKKNSDTSKYAFTSGTKAYYSLISTNNPLTLEEGQRMLWSGYYQFEPFEQLLN